MTMFSGLVTVGMFFAFGSVSGTVFTITGMVIRKMMRRTSITSTSGVVLIVVFSSTSSWSADWTFIDMCCVLAERARPSLLVGHEVGLQIRRKAAELLVDDLVATNDVVVE